MHPRMESREPLGPKNENCRVCYFGGRNPHMVAMSLHWEGKECLPAFKVLPFSFPYQTEVLRSCAHTHTKENSSFPEYQRWMEDHCNALSSLKTTQEAELKILRRKVDIVVDFSKQRRVAAKE